MMIHRMPVTIDLARVLCSGRFHQRTPLGDMLGDCWIRCYSVVHTYVISNYLILEEAWRSSVIYCHHKTHLTVHDEVKDRE
jgi:hypothetical protein